MKVNLCDNMLELENGQMIVKVKYAEIINCRWLISAQDDDEYVTLEFHNFNVRNSYFYTERHCFFKAM